MRYGIISDIHGNLEAFEAVMEALLREEIDEYLCGGDIVGYGADPIACIEKIKALGLSTVCGNHDLTSSDLGGIDNFSKAAREAVIWTHQNISRLDAAFLKKLNFVYKNKHLTLVHGTLREPEAFHYMFTRAAARATFNLMDTGVCFVGHSHAPGIFSYENETISPFFKDKAELSGGEKLIVNTGSVGQPRDGDPRACYCVYDTREGSVELKRIAYDIQKTQKKILEAGLAPYLANRLEQGL